MGHRGHRAILQICFVDQRWQLDLADRGGRTQQPVDCSRVSLWIPNSIIFERLRWGLARPVTVIKQSAAAKAIISRRLVGQAGSATATAPTTTTSYGKLVGLAL